MSKNSTASCLPPLSLISYSTLKVTFHTMLQLGILLDLVCTKLLPFVLTNNVFLGVENSRVVGDACYCISPQHNILSCIIFYVVGCSIE